MKKSSDSHLREAARLADLTNLEDLANLSLTNPEAANKYKKMFPKWIKKLPMYAKAMKRDGYLLPAGTSDYRHFCTWLGFRIDRQQFHYGCVPCSKASRTKGLHTSSACETRKGSEPEKDLNPNTKSLNPREFQKSSNLGRKKISKKRKKSPKTNL